MASEYLYGAYGHLATSVSQNALQGNTIAVYAGTAPVNLVRGWKELDLVNNPVRLTSFVQAQRTVGMSSDWESYTLCEAISAHFNNSNGNIGPIYVINVLDPETHVKADEVTVEVTAVSGKVAFVSDTVILDTVKVTTTKPNEGEPEGNPVTVELVEGKDYVIDYAYATKTASIVSVDPEIKLTGTFTITYNEVDPTKVVTEEIIGGISANGEYSGLSALQLLYNNEGIIANLLAAPGWSHEPAVYNALLTAASKINGHWDAYVVADLPLVDASSNAIDTITKAVQWKKDHAYNNEHSTVCWPAAKALDGSIYHLSTLAVTEYMRADASHDGVPMETCGNKKIPVIGQYFGLNSVNQGFDKITGNELTSNGITTCLAWGGKMQIWGDHTAAFKFGTPDDARHIFDVTMRMLKHITNSFQQEWAPSIDKPMTRNLRDRILNRERAKLDALVTRGALIGSPTVEFLESENSITDMQNGYFRFDVAVTPTPPLKAATVYVAYTDEGFNAYYD